MTTTTYGDNPFVPGMETEVYEPDQLIAGDFKLVTEGQAQFPAGLKMKRGTVLAQGSDGSYSPAKAAAPGAYAVLADDVDTTSGTAATGGVYLTGEFNGRALTLDPAVTLATMTPILRVNSIFVKSCVSAADPT
ncbi:head decoration protein [Caballeronia sp. BR00000012568055]|uniref:head decoration protein n=1 Tax=Caballeronia sp. BR00000012568055 TaxID=2918761 RepID=UPI0023F844F1|nr:head decoration protein [Caballeronia sp. BR00000012568055]